MRRFKRLWAGASVALLAVSLALPVGVLAQTPTRVVAPKNPYSVDKDVQLGAQAAQQAERQMPLLNDRTVQAYVSRVGARLFARTDHDGVYAFTGLAPGDYILEVKARGFAALTSDEFAAVRSVGFQPVGQVLGAAVYNVGYTGGYGCPGAWGGYNFGWGPAGVTQVSSKGGYGSFGPLVKTMYEARRAAISRMVAECAELGGHGVVGVRLSIGQFPAGGLEFKAIGTAVAAPGARC